MSAFLDFLAGFIRNLDFPATMLVMMMIGMAVAMERAQRQPDFNWGDAFKDDNGKVSWFRTAILFSLIISSWVLIYIFMNAIQTTATPQDLVAELQILWKYYITFLAVWSGSKIIDKGMDIVMAKYFPKPPTTP